MSSLTRTPVLQLAGSLRSGLLHRARDVKARAGRVRHRELGGQARKRIGARDATAQVDLGEPRLDRWHKGEPCVHSETDISL